MRKKVAVIGSGVSGLSAAWALARGCDVTLYEAEGRLGGHSDTFDWDGVGVDCGFIVYNERTYPNLTALFAHLGIETSASDMSFAVSVDEGDFEYSGGTLRGLVAQAGNVLKPRYWSMIKDILRFFREAPRDLARGDLGTLSAYLDARGYGQAFRNDYLYPMAAAVWSTPAMQVGEFPAANFIRFNANHGLLNLVDRPVWRTVTGGSRHYVRRLAEALGEVRAGAPVRGVRRVAGGVEVVADGAAQKYDDVVIAAHADDALNMLESPTEAERRALGAFPYLDNVAVLHTDARLMPKRRAAWSSWNYLASGEGDARRLTVSYWMNRLQPLPGRADVFLTLNPPWELPASAVLRRTRYRHPLFDAGAFAAQRDLWGLQGVGGVWFCGAYFGYGFHEDGLQAGLAVAEAISGLKRPWRVADESGRLAIPA